MATTTEILEAFAERIRGINGLRASAGDPESYNPPLAVIKPVARRAATLDRSTQYRSADVTVIVPWGTARTAQEALYPYMDESGDRSIEAKLMEDDTFGGLINGILAISIENEDNWGTYEVEGLGELPAGVLTIEYF
jgi:hypothetical protein